jgi:hypothetical protein
MLTKEIVKEIEESHIRMSSNDDVVFAVDVIDRLLVIINAFTFTIPVCEILGTNSIIAESQPVLIEKLEHSTDGLSCWCEPELIDGVIVHRRTDN